MAGSYSHVTDDETGKFKGFQNLENMKDMAEAVHEMWFMVGFLSGWDRHRIIDAQAAYYRCCRKEEPWPAPIAEHAQEWFANSVGR